MYWKWDVVFELKHSSLGVLLETSNFVRLFLTCSTFHSRLDAVKQCLGVAVNNIQFCVLGMSYKYTALEVIK